MTQSKKTEAPISFELSESELLKIASRKSNVELRVEEVVANNGYVIQNAPVPKSLV